MAIEMVFRPPLILASKADDAAKSFPIQLRIYGASSNKTDINRLRFRAFRDGGWIAYNATEEFVDDYDVLPSTFAIGAFSRGACVGSVRLAFGGLGCGPHSMPCQSQFPLELGELNSDGRQKLVEFSRMAVEPSLINPSFRATLYASLVRAAVILSTAATTDIAIIAVHRKVSPFYEAMCGFHVIGRAESYAEIHEPTDLLVLRFSEIDERRRRVNAFFQLSNPEIEAARLALSMLERAEAA